MNTQITRARRDMNLAYPQPLHPSAVYWGASAGEPRGVFWPNLQRVIMKHWKTSLVFALLLEMIFFAVVLVLHDTYEASATLEINPPNAQTVSLEQAAATPPGEQNYLDTQIEILRGDHLAWVVINDLHLQQNPIFLQESLFQRAVNTLAEKLPTHRKVPAGQEDVEHYLKIFRSGLSVAQDKNSQLVDVTYESRDPQLSTQIVTDMVKQYLEDAHRSRYESTLRAAQSLAPEMGDLRKSVEKSNQELVNFQKSHEGVELSGGATIGPDGTSGPSESGGAGNPIATRVSELNQQLTQAMGDRLQQESFVRQIQQGHVDTLPQMRDNLLIQDLTKRLVDSRAQLAQALAVYGGNNPQVRKLQEQTAELDNQLTAERTRIGGQIQAAYQSAETREQLLRRTLTGLKGSLDESNANVVQFDSLKREAQANSNLYIGLSSRIKELALSASLNSNNVRVLNEARLPLKPSGPHRFLILTGGLFVSLLGGLALAFVAEGMNDVISNVDDLRQVSELPALALVPESRLFRGNTRVLHLTTRSNAILGNGASHNGRGLPVKSGYRYNSLAEAEAIYQLETSIRLSSISRERAVRTVLITSPFPGEGKTTVAVNLAAALSRHDSTCLIDTDFRHPTIKGMFGPSAHCQLFDVLSRPELVQQLPVGELGAPNLTVLCAYENTPQAVETLTSKRMGDLLDALGKRFDHIILDSPPIIPFADARWLSSLSDGIVLVVRCSSTTRRAVTWTMEILDELRTPVLGVVLNGADPRSEYQTYGSKDSYSYRTD
jgi:polysaccharide biosynthesis transport protein